MEKATKEYQLEKWEVPAISWHDKFICNRSYKILERGKKYKVVGFGRMQGKEEHWIIKTLYDNNLEYKIFRTTLAELNNKGIITKIK